MTDGALADRLDRTIDLVIGRGDATAALTDAELAPLVTVAAELRHYAGAAFKARLRASLERRQVRPGFTTITPYITVHGTGMVDFLAQVFGAVETSGGHGSAGRHREVRIGDSMVMIGEVPPERHVAARLGEFHVYVEDADAAFGRALAAGAVSLGEPANRPYGERAGFVKDRFGNHWFIATHLGGTAVPEGLRTVTPFVHASGTAQYIEFLTQAFGAAEEERHAMPDGRVVYARLRIGDAAIELGEADESATPMRTTFYLYVDDPDALYGQALRAGATSLSPPARQPYGERIASVEDRIGNQWFMSRPV